MKQQNFYTLSTVFEPDNEVDRKTPFTQQVEGFNSFMNINRNWHENIEPDFSDFYIKKMTLLR